MIYSGKIRNGSYGKITADDYDVVKCFSCGIIKLDTTQSDDFYESDSYRKTYNDEATIEKYHDLHDILETDKISLIGIHNFRNKTIADFGSGGGSFLDACKGLSSRTIAIEPSKLFHHHLAKKHTVFSYGPELVKSAIKVDVATSFDVIEHVTNPVLYLKDVFKTLDEKGILYLMTPNYNDILRDLISSDFNVFDFRTAHLFYFTAESIEFTLKQAGFSKIDVNFHHKRDMSNLLGWMRDRRPTGNNSLKIFDDDFNYNFKKYIEKLGKSSHLFVSAKK